MPIFMTRLVDDSGWIMTGGPAQLGSWATVSAIRSPTHWRAWRTFVPGLKIISIDESCGTDFDRMTSRPGTPLRASSSGTVTRDSTSDGDSPRDGVWTSTFGGANSGKTSTGECWSCSTPANISPAARATTRKRNFRLEATTRRIIADRPPPVPGSQPRPGTDDAERRGVDPASLAFRGLVALDQDHAVTDGDGEDGEQADELPELERAAVGQHAQGSADESDRQGEEQQRGQAPAP